MTAAPPTVDNDLIVALQEGLPVERRPFAVIGESLGLSEEAVVARLRDLFETGVARRLGAVFDSRSLGYESTLCAADIPAAELVAAAGRIHPHPGITHCYEREGHPNLWFTLTAPRSSLETELARISKAIGPYGVMSLPALRKFKIEAVFGTSSKGNRGGEPGGGGFPGETLPPLLSEREKDVVRCLQGSIALERDLFGAVARQVGYGPAELIALLQRWQGDGIIRRIALVVRHRQLGFSANSMCVWKVAPEALEAAGQGMARSPHVTHCYERPSSPSFPYNLYAMIHGRSPDEAMAIFRKLGDDAGLAGGKMMWSVREFKKSSPIFFCESDVELGGPSS